jgi:hypothetical protein
MKDVLIQLLVSFAGGLFGALVFNIVREVIEDDER